MRFYDIKHFALHCVTGILVFLYQIPKVKDSPGDPTMVEVSFRLEDSDADMIYAHDDVINSQISGIIDEIKVEERRYVDILECISKVCRTCILE